MIAAEIKTALAGEHHQHDFHLYPVIWSYLCTMVSCVSTWTLLIQTLVFCWCKTSSLNSCNSLASCKLLVFFKTVIIDLDLENT